MNWDGNQNCKSLVGHKKNPWVHWLRNTDLDGHIASLVKGLKKGNCSSSPWASIIQNMMILLFMIMLCCFVL